MIYPETVNAARSRAIPGLLILLILVLALAACGGSEDTGRDEDTGGTTGQDGTTETAASVGRYILPGDEVYPEGIAYDPRTGDFFVGSTTAGTIFRGNAGLDEGDAEILLEPGGDRRETAVGMKVDEGGRLFIAAGDTGRIFVYDTASRELVRALDTPGSETAFINDVAVAPDGSAYFTDSMRPTLFRVPVTSDGGVGEVEPWLELEGTLIEYEEGFNLNGIAATRDGRYLITVQSNTGNLYRIDTESREVTQVDLGGETLTGGDGILLDGQILYVVCGQDGLITPVELAEDFASGEAGEGFSDPSFARPTTIAKFGNRLLVVNSQFDRRESGASPELPFTVSGVETP